MSRGRRSNESVGEISLISRRGLDLMMTMKDGYGMGMFPYEYDNNKGYGHNGRVEESYSMVQYYPGKILAISYVTNGILFPRNDIVENKYASPDLLSFPPLETTAANQGNRQHLHLDQSQMKNSFSFLDDIFCFLRYTGNQKLLPS